MDIEHLASRIVKHGTSIVIECLHHVFVDYKTNRGHIPPVVYVQFDNT